MLPNFRAFTLWPEWCAAFKGVLLRDGSPSQLDKEWENRPIAPWSTIAPQRGVERLLPGPWFCMHAGAHIGGKPRNEGALGDVIETAKGAGWRASVVSGGRDGSVRLAKGDQSTILRPEFIVRSAIVALIRVVDVQQPGEGEWTPWRYPSWLHCYGWKLDVRPLPNPIPCRGAQGLWTLDDATDAAVRAQRDGLKAY